MDPLRALLLLLFLPLLLAAPSACGGGDADETSSAGTFSATPAATVTTDTGTYRIEVHSAPDALPTRGVNELRLIVTHASDGTPASGLVLAIVPFMPAMGHGGSVTPTVSADAVPGTYSVSNVYFFMPGLWELRTTVATNENATAQFEVQ